MNCVWRAIAEGKLKVRRVGKRMIVLPEDGDAYLRSLPEGPGPKPASFQKAPPNKNRRLEGRRRGESDRNSTNDDALLAHLRHSPAISRRVGSHTHTRETLAQWAVTIPHRISSAGLAESAGTRQRPSLPRLSKTPPRAVNRSRANASARRDSRPKSASAWRRGANSGQATLCGPTRAAIWRRGPGRSFRGT